MKKRILSLLLAFAMAATLAPATALVGGNIAKAAAGQVEEINGTPVATATGEIDGGVAKLVNVDVNKFIKDGKKNIDFKFEEATTLADTALYISQVDQPQQGIKINVKEISANASKTKRTFEFSNINRAVPGVYTFHVSKLNPLASGNTHTTPHTVAGTKIHGTAGNVYIQSGMSFDFTINVKGDYKVTLNLDGGDLDSTLLGTDPDDYVKNSNGTFSTWALDNAQGEYKADWTILDMSKVTKPGYILSGWTSQTSGVPSVKDLSGDHTIDRDVTFKAVWTKDTVPVNLIANKSGDTQTAHVEDGTAGTLSVIQDLGTSLPKNTFVKPGYTFKGWTQVDNGGIVRWANGATITSDMVKAIAPSGNLYAIWEPITYTINFNINLPEDAKVGKVNQAMASVKKTYDDNDFELPACTYAVNNYQFLYWATDAEGNNRVEVTAQTDSELGNEEGASSITLYAVWKSGNSVVVYEGEAGTASNKVYGVYADDYDVMTDATLKYTMRIGYAVEKWTDAEGTATNSLSYDDDGFAYVYPVYGKPLQYDVYYSSAGTLTTNETYKMSINSGNINLPKYSVAMKTLSGWDVAETDAAESYKTSFNAKELIEAIIDEQGKVDGIATLMSGITFVADYLDNAASGNVATETPDFSVAYGTLKSDVERYIQNTTVVNMEDDSVETAGKGISKIVWTSNSYSPLKPGTYSFRGTVYLDAGVVGAANNNQKITDVKVTVLAEDDITGVDTTQNSAYELATIPAINISGDATRADIVYELENQVAKVKGDNDKKEVEFELSDSDEWSISRKDTFPTSSGTGTALDPIISSITGTQLKDVSLAQTIYVAGRNPQTLYAIYDELDSTSKIDMPPTGATSPTTMNANMYDFTPQVVINISAKGAAPSTPDKEEQKAEIIEKAKKLMQQNVIIRMYKNGEHMYVFDLALGEITTMLNNGWKFENNDAGTNSFKASATETAVYNTPVYRVRNSNNGGMHFYTKSLGEAQLLVTKYGWKADNNLKPVFYVSSDATGNKVYRSYNPNSKNGEHNWTVNKAEHDGLVKLGWKDESIDANVWYSPAN